MLVFPAWFMSCSVALVVSCYTLGHGRCRYHGRCCRHWFLVLLLLAIIQTKIYHLSKLRSRYPKTINIFSSLVIWFFFINKLLLSDAGR